MYSAEPLPHFVDEYLAYLYEINPTTATFDGVHVHDDLLEDFSRSAIDAQVRTLGGFARRLAAIDPARLTDIERLERPALESSIRARAVRARRGAHLGAQPAALRRHAGDQPRRPGALRLRAARRARAPRPVEAAPGAALDAGGARQHQGSARHLRQGRAREPARHAALHPRRSAARVRRPRRSAPARRSRRCVDRSVDLDRSCTSSFSRPISRRAARARSASAASVSSRSSRLDEGITVGADRLLAIATRELQKTQDEFRRVASRVNGGDPLAAWQKTKADHPPAGKLVSVAEEQLAELADFIRRERIITLPEGAPVAGAPDAALLSLDVREHVDAGAVRVAAGSRVLLHHRRRSVVAAPSGRTSTCATSTTARCGRSRSTRSFPATSCTTSTCARSSRRCASRSSSRRRRSSKAGRTTASR